MDQPPRGLEGAAAPSARDVLDAISDMAAFYRDALAGATTREQRLLDQLSAARDEVTAARQAAAEADGAARLASLRAGRAEARMAEASQAADALRAELDRQRASLEVARDRELQILGAIRTYLDRSDRAFATMRAAAESALRAVPVGGTERPAPAAELPAPGLRHGFDVADLDRTRNQG